MTPEGKVKQAVVKLLKQHGVYYFFPATHGYGRSGVPDVVCCVKGASGNGHFVAIECKANGNTPTALQEREMQSIREAGGAVIVISETNLPMLEGFLLGVKGL